MFTLRFCWRRDGWRVVVQFFLALLLVGCGSSRRPEIGALYNRSAQSGHDLRNPVILIPGILGSQLKDEATGTVVWGAFDAKSANPRSAPGRRLIALPMTGDRTVPLENLRDGVKATEVLSRVQVKLLGIPVELRAYSNILRTLGAGGYRDPAITYFDAVDYGDDHFTCFQFAYDWRRDLAENAALLAQFIEEKKLYVERELKERYDVDRDVQFDLVAHSMGGLLARYFLRYGDEPLPEGGEQPTVTWKGAEVVDKAILVGAPNHGSVKALEQLAFGWKPAAFIARYPAAMLGTMPGPFQLLPRTRHQTVVDSGSRTETAADLYDVELWKQQEWGLADPQQAEVLAHLLPEIDDPAERRQVALAHLERLLERAKEVNAALDQPAERPPGLELYLVAGDAQPTDSVLAIDSRGRLKSAETAAGDGTVTRASALADERIGGEWQPHLQSPVDWSHVTFIFSNHLGLTRSPMFVDNLLFTLLESP